MKNLDQIRAHNALLHKDRISNSQGGGDAISGFPMLVYTDGLLAALAFACEWKEIKERDYPQNPPTGFYRHNGQGRDAKYYKRKHEGEFTVARAITEHLCCQRNTICNATDADDLLKQLADQTTYALLRRATAETLAFLNYLKRFVA